MSSINIESDPLDECTFVGSVFGKHAREDFKEFMKRQFGLRTNNRKDWDDQYRSWDMEFTAFKSPSENVYTFNYQGYGTQQEIEKLVAQFTIAFEAEKVGYQIEIYDGHDNLSKEMTYKPTAAEVAERERIRVKRRTRQTLITIAVVLLICVTVSLFAIPWTDNY
ncbi:hypothetical protein Pla110_33660 [Polystyrenella longa]|uniref:Uncharacterized protein n=1 Tax=Polystyrenella longa TaxID=2528007 RepID=A0A518CQX9_9PLAN|nr:hypothetical protein [Polystyrenella longa]QDU81623.1 hypothetical protein Pla110_33660 [Polystyrenella longa]